MEAQEDALDTTRILNINLSQEVDQLNSRWTECRNKGSFRAKIIKDLF